MFHRVHFISTNSSAACQCTFGLLYLSLIWRCLRYGVVYTKYICKFTSGMSYLFWPADYVHSKRFSCASNIVGDTRVRNRERWAHFKCRHAEFAHTMLNMLSSTYTEVHACPFDGMVFHANGFLSSWCDMQVLPAAIECLAPGGRLGVISFHSLEDRIVKQAFRYSFTSASTIIIVLHIVACFLRLATNVLPCSPRYDV